MNKRALGRLTIVPLLLSSTVAEAGSREIHYVPTPTWVVAPPPPTATPSRPDTPARFLYLDTQGRITPEGEETYSHWRLKILSPEGLKAADLILSWIPTSDDMSVHKLMLIHEGRETDVLAAQKFAIIQRENGLESAMLDGALTASLQAAGVQIGDEIEFAASTRHHDPNLGDIAQGFAQLPVVDMQGRYRIRYSWPANMAMQWRATPDLPAPDRATEGGQQTLTYMLADPQTVVTPEGAPPRYKVHRLVQYSSLGSWADLSHKVVPLFDSAAVLKSDSPIKAEAKRIAQEPDATKRAEAALQLVEDQIRYVYVGLDGGNYRPATADETWSRRFGDCKAKTVLLVALLRELGIEAEPVLVNSSGGDGINERLPSPALFDHVVVRATIGGKTYWLDATRLGDRKLAALPRPPFRWGLPLRASAVDLEAIPTAPPTDTTDLDVMDIDTRAGFTQPATYQLQRIMRGNKAASSHAQLAAMSPADADRALYGYWHQETPWIDPTKTSWRYDADRNVLLLTLNGTGKADWEGNDKDGHSLTAYGAGFFPPDERKRPKEQDQNAPWATDHPYFRCVVTTIHLPPAGAKWRWDYSSRPMNRSLGGVEYWRVTSLDKDVLRVVKSTRTLVPEVAAAEAARVNLQIPEFDNNMSQVFQTPAKSASEPKPGATQAQLGIGNDWMASVEPCFRPRPF